MVTSFQEQHLLVFTFFSWIWASPVTCFWSVVCDGSDAVWLLRLGHEKPWSFVLGLLNAHSWNAFSWDAAFLPWEGQALWKGHVHVLWLVAPDELPACSQHQLFASWLSHLGCSSPVESLDDCTSTSMTWQNRDQPNQSTYYSTFKSIGFIIIQVWWGQRIRRWLPLKR